MAKQATEIFTAPWYPWYVRDVLTSEGVDTLSLAEEGAYRRALDKAWMTGSVPNDPKELAAVIGKSCTPKIAAKVLTLFVKMPRQPKRAINLRLERVRAEQFEKYEKKVRAGEARAAQRAAEKAALEASKNGGPVSSAKAPLEHSGSYTETDTDTDSFPKGKDEGEKSPAAPRPRQKGVGTRIPDPFNLTKQMRDWAEAEEPHVDVHLETKMFVNHFRGASGSKGVKVDWLATWKNWMHREGKKLRENGNGKNRGDNAQQPQRETSRDRLDGYGGVLAKYQTESDLGSIA